MRVLGCCNLQNEPLAANKRQDYMYCGLKECQVKPCWLFPATYLSHPDQASCRTGRPSTRVWTPHAVKRVSKAVNIKRTITIMRTWVVCGPICQHSPTSVRWDDEPPQSGNSASVQVTHWQTRRLKQSDCLERERQSGEEWLQAGGWLADGHHNMRAWLLDGSWYTPRFSMMQRTRLASSAPQ